MFFSVLAALLMTYGVAGTFNKESLASLRFIQEPTSTIARKNAAVTLDCGVEGSARPKIRWTRNGRTIHVDSRRTVLPSGALRIRRVLHRRDHQPDIGEYQCFASSTVGTIASRKVLLDVAAMSKKFLYEPQNSTSWIGSVARFSCQVRHSIPPATISWEKDGIPLNSSERLIIWDHGVLQIANVKNSDEGRYRCVAKNVARTRFSQYASLTVRIVSDGTSLQPKFLGVPLNTSVVKGSSVVMDCAASGYPVPVVSWRKTDNRWLRAHSSPQAVLGIANLNFTNSEEGDGGEYVCEATSGGHTITRSVWLFVKVGPRFTLVPRSIRRTTGEVIPLKCGATGSPMPLLSWYRNGTKLTTNKRITITSYEGGTDLRISNITAVDTGMYQCFAENEVGMIQSSASVVVHSRANQPGPPTSVIALPHSASSILVSWSPPVGKFNITAFTVHSLKLDGENAREMQEVVGQSTHSYVMEGLQGYTKYSFYIRAYTSSAFGRQSDVVVASTLQGSPRGAPTDIKVSSITPDSLDVAWQPPQKDLQNGIITKYVIKYEEEVSRGQSLPSTLEVQGNTLMKTINGLTKGKTYRVKVSAATKIGLGPPSVPVSGTVLLQSRNVVSAPTLWISERNASVLKVEWLPPKYGQDRVAEYRLYYGQLGKTEKGPFILGKEDQSYSLRGLAADSQFLIKLMAWDGESLGRPGVVHGITDKDPHASASPPIAHPDIPPSRPINLMCTVESPTSLLVTWQRPLSANRIASYTVKYFLRNSLNPKPVERKAFSENIIITGLSSGKDYTISIQSHYAVDVNTHPGFSTTQKHCVIPESKPLSSPSNIKFMFKTVRSVEITWEKPNGKVTGYKILYSYNITWPEDKWIEQHEPVGFFASRAKVLSTRLTGIKENMTFYLKMCAENKIGFGPFSDVLTVRPPISTHREPPLVTHTSISQSLVRLSWKCPRVFDVLIISFTVLFTNDKSLPEDRWTKQTVVFDSLKRFPSRVNTMMSVEPNRTYYTKVRAEYDDFAPGPWSTVVVVSTHAKDKGDKDGGTGVQVGPTEQANEENPDFNVKLGVIIGCTISAFFIVLLVLFIVWRNPCRHAAPKNKKDGTVINGFPPGSGFLASHQQQMGKSGTQGQSESTEETSGSSGLCQCRCTCGAGARWPLGPTITRTNNHLPGSSDSSTPLANNSHVFTPSTQAGDSEGSGSGSHQEFNKDREPRNTASSLSNLSVELHRDGKISTAPAVLRSHKQSVSVDV